MREIIYELMYNDKGLTVEEIITRILMAAVLGLFIYLSYAISHRGAVYSKKFNVSLLPLTVITGAIMTVIGNNVALSLGMVGALSIVRFRTALKDSRDTVYIFWAIMVGICCGVGDYMVGGVGSAAAFTLLLIFGCIKNDNRFLLVIRGSRSVEMSVKSLVFQMFRKKAVLRVENTTQDSFELIYEVSGHVLKKVQESETGIVDAIYDCGKIDYVNLILQNDEISG